MTLLQKNKKWYQSRTIWAGITVIVVTVWDNAVVPGFNEYLHIILPVVPQWIYGLLGSLGILGRVQANKPIGK